MNSLFDGFDLTDSTVKATKTPKKKKQPEAQKQLAITNQQLFSDCGEGLDIELNKPKPESLAKKAAAAEEGEVDATKILKSKKISLNEKLAIIKLKVLLYGTL